ALPNETLHVIRFQGQEGINELFSFTIELVSPNMSLDTETLLSDRAVFSITREDGSQAVFNGYPARVKQGGAFNGYCYYTVELRPALWKMTQIVRSHIFLNQTLGETLAELLRSEPFFSFPFALDFTDTDYPRREFAMQYEESVYDYLCWRLEEQGAYYYFEQSDERDTLHFADSPVAHRVQAHTPVLRYAPVSGLEGTRVSENVTAFSLSQSQLPRQVVIRSYNWTNPNKPIVGTAQVSGNGLGDVYLTGEDVENDAEAERLARLRAEALRCQARRFSGTSAAPDLRPGYTFQLQEHHNAALNQEYLVTQVTHEGSQESFINLGLGIPLEGVSDHLFYRNDFACIEAGTPFRPQRTASRAKISGVIHAFIDGASDGSRPEIDEYGRYKLLFPFDVSGRRDGDASCWIRRAQEQVGKNSGMSSPLLNGTEVLVSFLDGNPDRPYITGALANAETGALTGSGNANVQGLRTQGGNQLVFDDTAQKQGLALRTAGGSGYSIVSGSMDLGIQQASMAVDVTTAAATGVHATGATFFSVNKISNYVGDNPDGMMGVALKVLIQGSQAIANGIGGKLDSSSSVAKAAAQKDVDSQSAPGTNESGANESDPTASLYEISAAKAVMSLINYGALSFCDRTAPNYGYNLTSGQKSTFTTMWANPDLTQLLLFSVLTLGTDAVQIGMDAEESGRVEKALDSGTMKDSAGDTLDKTANLQSKYMQNAKSYAKNRPYARIVSDLVPEVVATILLAIQYGRQKGHALGGVLVKAPDANINLSAKNAIGLHSEHGILLNTRAADPASVQKVLGDSGYANLSEWGLAEEQLVPGDPERIKKLFNFYNKDAMKYTVSDDPSAEDLQKLEMDFLADVTQLRYTDAVWQVANVDKVSKTLAFRHILASSSEAEQNAAQKMLQPATAANTAALGAVDGVMTQISALSAAPGMDPISTIAQQMQLREALQEAQKELDRAVEDLRQATERNTKAFSLKKSQSALVIQNGSGAFTKASSNASVLLSNAESPGDAPGIFAIAKNASGVLLESDAAKILLDPGEGCRVEAKLAASTTYGLIDTKGILFKSLDQSSLQMDSDGIVLKADKDGRGSIELKKDKITLKTSPDKYVIGKLEIDANAIKNTTGTLDIQSGAIKIIG
ncbi:MAG: type VI secretion system tip protein VgrG, partial [Zoogloeaceae bacterium]|nr:type VI secretion system tip protein VgrG [Zoogloeaceae bacterium]